MTLLAASPTRAVLALVTLAAATLVPAEAQAADHRDGVAVQGDPATDLGDVHAWMSPDGGKVYLVLTVSPGATAASRFSNAALYVFHLSAGRSLSDPAPSARTIVCRFDVQQRIACWGPESSGLLVEGDASAPVGLASADGRMRVFAGLRADAFFFNLEGFAAMTSALGSALVKTPSGCPDAIHGSGTGLAALLARDRQGGPGKDAYRQGGEAGPGGYSGNVLALVVSIDRELVADNAHPVLAVWASTNRQ